VGAEAVRWRGAGPGGRFDRGGPGARDQMEARRALARVGLLGEVPTCDGQPEAQPAARCEALGAG